jgi:hypothetical protein
LEFPTSSNDRQRLQPDIIGDVQFYETRAGGRREAIARNRFACPFRLQGELIDCVLLLDEVGPILPGQRVKVPIKFLSPHLIKYILSPGQRFELWDMRVFAEGTILSISS